MRDDLPENPADLGPGPEQEIDRNRLKGESPDTFDTPLDAEDLENELPEEGVTPEDVAFEEDLEDDLDENSA